MSLKYVIESRRYEDNNGNKVYDSWTSVEKDMEIEDGFVMFIPIDGEHAGLKHYITFPNIHIVREYLEPE